MSGTYFCFSDECGNYLCRPSQHQVRVHPYYIRTTLLINSIEWKKINFNFRVLKSKYEIPITQEVKWAFLWSLKSYQDKRKPLPCNHELKLIEHIPYNKLVDFVEEVLSLINQLQEKKIVITYTKNTTFNNVNERSILSFHLQDHMQRVEMELQCDESNLGVMFIDPIDYKKNEMLRQIYHELFLNGDIIKRYNFLKDSLNIENSHHSVGIQVADYISGSFSSVLKTNCNGSHDRGVKMFFRYVYPYLRRSRSGNIQGYGIREVPQSQNLRKWLIQKINANKIRVL